VHLFMFVASCGVWCAGGISLESSLSIYSGESSC
jgi:hypothetical protein